MRVEIVQDQTIINVQHVQAQNFYSKLNWLKSLHLVLLDALTDIFHIRTHKQAKNVHLNLGPVKIMRIIAWHVQFHREGLLQYAVVPNILWLNRMMVAVLNAITIVNLVQFLIITVSSLQRIEYRSYLFCPCPGVIKKKILLISY